MPQRAQRIHAFPGLGNAVRDTVEAAFSGREFVVWEDPAEFEAGIAEAEVLLALQPPRGHWERARSLRLIQMTGAGVDSLLPAPDLPARVRIANARGVHEPEMSEFILASILALLKQLPRAMQQQRQHRWKPYGSRPLTGQTVGILGVGAIGCGLARRCRALGMRVIGTRRRPEPLPDIDAVFGPEDTSRVLAESDVVVVLLPLTPETRGLLDAAALAGMKPRARIVNVARGGIVDEAAVARALERGELAGAAFDVFSEEPLPADSPLWDAPNAIVTPHVAGLSPHYMDRVGKILVENVRRLERGEPLLNEVDRRRGY
jgi:phosphoglycerate dehydrogenase-like enzyme